MSGESRSAGILGAHKILAELLCPAPDLARNSIAATPSRSDFIYTEMVARRRFEFYLHRDGCAAAIRVLSTQRFVRRGDLILIDLRKNDDMFKNFPRCARSFITVFLRKNDDMFKNFPRCARSFIKGFLKEKR